MNKDYLTNLTFGITFLNLAIVGITALNLECTFQTVVRLGSVLCNLMMGTLLLFNKRSVSAHGPLYKPFWLLMIICNMLIVKMIDGEQPALSVASFLFVTGLVAVLFSLFSLGGSFAVTPMSSEVKTRFAYGLVRHPMYLGESVMVMACVLATRNLLSIPVFLLFVLSVVLRIREEEALLVKSEQYRLYCTSTRWRIIPFVW